MLQICDIAIFAIAAYAISLTASSSDWSYGNVGTDVKLFFFAVGACWMSFRFMFKQAQVNDLAESAPVVQPDATNGDGPLVQPKDMDFADDLKFIQKCAWERNIGGAVGTFRLMKESGCCLSHLLFNTMLQAYVNCGNIQAAEDWMDVIKEAQMADECSFHIIIKALVTSRTLEKANTVLVRDMKNAGVRPSITAFNEVLGGFVREGQCEEACSLFDQMNSQDLKPTSITLNSMTKLINGTRNISQNNWRFDKILSQYNFELNDLGRMQGVRTYMSADALLPMPLPSPCLAGVLSHAKDTTRASCAHEIRLSGRLPQMKAARRTLKQLGFLDKAENGGGPLDGHWETDRGFTVVIEGKIVRWSARNASKLRYTKADRRACVLTLYGEASHGQLVPLSEAPDSSEALRWDNGDVWYPCDSRAVGQHVLFSQTMTKTLRDTMQDDMYRARAGAVLKRVSKQTLHMPSVVEDAITQFLGNDLYYISIQFESRWNPSLVDDDDAELASLKAAEDFGVEQKESQDICIDDDEMLSPEAIMPLLGQDQNICVSLSRRHPRVGLRHCWADRSDDNCGQQTWVNGEELDDYCFCRHIGAVTWA